MSYPYTSTTPQLGWQPIPIVPIFSLHEDWIVTLVSSDPTFTWPPGSVVVANVYASRPSGTPPDYPPPVFSWPGAISGGEVTFDAPSADTDTVAAGSIMRVHATMPSGSPDGFDSYVWAQGKVSRRDGT